MSSSEVQLYRQKERKKFPILDLGFQARTQGRGGGGGAGGISKSCSFSPKNRDYTLNFDLKIRIFLRFAPPL